MRFYFELNDKCFCSKEGDLVLLEQNLFLQNLFSAIGAHIFIVPIFHFLSPKLKGRRIKRKKKDRKLRRKIERISFDFFQLLPVLFSIKRNCTEKAIEFIPSLIPFFRIRKNNEKRAKLIIKRKKRNKKKEKRGEKGSDFSVFSRFLNLLLLSQKRKGRRKKGENPP